ncbi:hypothetical protein RO3G_02875 [Rhizopus delemar RA 99-880]|uniref:Uncharacterized protein n=1 Tax=Rhizopus delemar (strain RA 99-880 / ATCC MYA-4621 / FGSC 9543 / NRRL 43880) TaxID=246409 RepID=I1BPP1_RHIO9|nr:hypothetical protein RO3G_02875 [Rhizopus delemar RA 99-880]|eukprot:EIE78171.1 hypothetical protein RO3G_02875 [Rhizopus delemar RA 99-880]
MSSNFFYKDGKGNIVGENGNEAMDFEVEFDPYNLGILFTLTQYRSSRNRFLAEPTEELDVRMEEAAEAVTSRKYNVYTDKHKAVFYYFNRKKRSENVRLVEETLSKTKSSAINIVLFANYIEARTQYEDLLCLYYSNEVGRPNHSSAKFYDQDLAAVCNFKKIPPELRSTSSCPVCLSRPTNSETKSGFKRRQNKATKKFKKTSHPLELSLNQFNADG